jgi:hypothetical protein
MLKELKETTLEWITFKTSLISWYVVKESIRDSLIMMRNRSMKVLALS